MLSIKRILCPVDFSDTSAHAVEQAVAVAGWYKARITALHVYNPMFIPVPGLPAPTGEVPELDAQRLRAETTAVFQPAVAAGIGVDVVIAAAPPADRILERADSLSADMIVMGTHGASGIEHLVLGSVTEKVLRKARCAVMTVPPRARATSTLPFKRVLCAVDFSEPSLAALRLASSLAGESAAALIVLHVLEWPWQEPPRPLFTELPSDQALALAEFRRYLETSALKRLDSLVPEPLKHRCESRVRNGKPYVEILRVAEEERADLIVMGVHGRSVLDLTLFGSTTNQLVRRATCPVLTLRQ